MSHFQGLVKYWLFDVIDNMNQSPLKSGQICGDGK